MHLFITQYSFFIILLSFFGLIYCTNNYFKIVILIELLLLMCNLIFLFTALKVDDLQGEIFSFFILTLAACETAIGLSILVCYFKFKGDLIIANKFLTRY